MKDALELNIRGIKCDHCDYVNMNVKVEDYDKWLNKPCPKCGTNLLTQEDFDNTKALIELTNIMNNILPQREDNEKLATMQIKMNGTGEMDFQLDDLGKDIGGMPRYCYEDSSKLCPHYGKMFCMSPCPSCRNKIEFGEI